MSNKDTVDVILYTDGACSGNPGPGGWAAVLKLDDQDYRKEFAGGYKLTTNNRMEILAVVEALSQLQSPCEVELYCDSKYLVDAMSLGWVERWKAPGWCRNKTDEAVNPDLWERLLTACSRHTVKFVWVKGHAGHRWNEICDELSKQAAASKDLPPDEGYER